MRWVWFVQTYFLSDPFLRRDLEGVSVGVWVGTVRGRGRGRESVGEKGKAIIFITDTAMWAVTLMSGV